MRTLMTSVLLIALAFASVGSSDASARGFHGRHSGHRGGWGFCGSYDYCRPTVLVSGCEDPYFYGSYRCWDRWGRWGYRGRFGRRW
ncbi:MAG: hypothetical protein HY815_05365 [Candidatus Riflebacteria bacterium]|nr:hypothetical protein [Candidatus Riflebacteria bacterium]